MGQKSNFIGYILFRYSVVIILLLLWEAAPRFGWVDSQFLPSLSNTMKELFNLWVNGDLFMHIMVSLWRSLNGLIIAAAIAIPLGMVLGRFFPQMVNTLNPLFRIFAQVNPFSLMPIFILFFGIGEIAKLAVVAWVCIWPILFNTITGVRMVEADLVKSALALDISQTGLVIKVIIPGSAPSIFSGLRVGVEMSFFMLIAAEMIGAYAGLGWLMHNSAMNYQIQRIYAASLCIIALGVLLNKFLRFFQNRLLFWKEESTIFGSAMKKRSGKRFNKIQLVLIAMMLIGITVVGSLQVNKASLEGSSVEKHNHLKMDSASGSW